MKRILFVDNEREILLGQKLMLHPMRKEWDMSFVDSAKSALELMEKNESFRISCPISNLLPPMLQNL